MVDYETYVRIRNYFTNEGLKYSQIAHALGLDNRTVARWANEKQYQPRKSTQRKSKLDPFKNDIIRMPEKHSYTAAQINQILDLTDPLDQKVRYTKFTSRKEFWNQLGCTIRILIFSHWQSLLQFIWDPVKDIPP